MTKLWLEAWTRPGDASFGQLDPDVPVRRCSFTSRLNGVGEADAIIPDTYDLSTLFDSDPDTPANSKTCLFRIFAEDHVGPVADWIPSYRALEQDARDPDQEIPGQGIESILSYARTEPFDWNGDDDQQSRFPDWIWGGRNILGDVSARYIPEVTELFIRDADDGTYTLTVINDDGTDTTAALDYDATALQINVALANLSNVQFVEVDGDYPTFRIQFGDASQSYIISANSASLVGKWKVAVFATGGTFTVTVDGNPSGNIAYNASAAAMTTALEAITGITDVTVTKTVSSDPNHAWTIEFVTPDSASTFTINDAGLTGTGANGQVSQANVLAQLSTVQQSSLRPAGWETSNVAYLSNLPHGEILEFRMWETGDPTAPAGCSSDQIFMFNGTEWAFPGVQKVQNVKPGGLYQAHAFITSEGADDVVRFVIRDLAENLIGQDEQLITTPGTFQEFTISDITIPDNVDQVIVRVGHVGVGDPGRIFVGCPTLREGMAEASPGEILDALYQDAVSNHLADGRLVWDDGSGTTPYLTLDFTDALDSDSQAWTDTEISLTIKRGMSFLGAVGELAKLGYEFRVVADDWELGTYLLQVYNNGTLGTDYTSADSPSIEGGRDDIRRDVRVFQPPFTDVAVEGANQNFGRARNANLLAALGRIEGYKPEQDLGSLVEVAQAADAYAANANAETLSLSYTLAPGEGHDIPLVDYVVGDLLRVQDPPISMNRRIALVQVVFGSENTEYVVQAGTASYVGALAVGEAVRILTAEFKAIRQTPPENMAEIYQALSGGGTIPWLVAASDAPDEVKKVAGFICDGADDEAEFTEAFSLFNEVWASEGTFSLTIPGTTNGAAFEIPAAGLLRGAGRGHTSFEPSGFEDTAAQGWLVRSRGSISGIAFFPFTFNGPIGSVWWTSAFNQSITDCYFEQQNESTAILVQGSTVCRIERCYLEGDSGSGPLTAPILHLSRCRDIQISHCEVTGGSEGIILQDLPGGGIVNTSVTIHDLTVTQCQFDGILVDGAQWPKLHDLVLYGNGRSVNTFSAATPYADVRVSDCADFSVHDCQFESGNGLIPSVSIVNSTDGRVAGCRMEDIAAHGIFLDLADTVQIHHNIIPADANVSSLNTFDYIHVTGASHQVFVEANQLGTQGAGDMRYGINFESAAITCSKCVANTLGPTGTNPINNAAGAEVELFYPSDATWGDNWTSCPGS